MSREKQLFGFEVVEALGDGAGSQVYGVRRPGTGQGYALKHVVVGSERQLRFVEQLEAEYEVGRLVNHPGLRKSIELKVVKRGLLLRKVSEAGLVLEMLEGKPLEQALPSSVERIVEVFVQVAEALGALHRSGFVHCDLKPNNILVDSRGVVKVIDLGQACRAGTVKQRIQGTPDFMAPEQVRCEAVDGRTDVYNLGATLYWALTGVNLPTLFTAGRGENSFLVASEVRTPRELNPMVPERLSELVMQCVRTQPEKRPADMAEVSRRLELALHVMRKGRVQSQGKRRGEWKGQGESGVAGSVSSAA